MKIYTLIYLILLVQAFAGQIQVTGLKKTKPEVVLREFSQENFSSSPRDSLVFEEGLRRLRNMGLFSLVEGAWNNGAPQLNLTEKWTTIPIIKAGRGGGVNTLTAGIYDPNIAGRYLELGAQYIFYGGTHSGVAWWREPRFLNKRLLFGGDFWYTHKLMESYLGDSSLGWVGWRRMRAHVFIEPELNSHLVIHGAIEGLQDTLNSQLLPLLDGQSVYTRSPLGSKSFMATASLRWGQLNYNLETVQGFKIEPKLKVGFETPAQQTWFLQSHLEVLGFWLAHPRLNLALRHYSALVTTDSWFHQYSLGGLEFLRGLPENFYNSKTVWVQNLEFRWTCIQRKYLRLQFVPFLDMGGTDFNNWSMLGGGGVRFMSPKIYRLSLRADYGLELGGRQRGFSAGMQHFF